MSPWSRASRFSLPQVVRVGPNSQGFFNMLVRDGHQPNDRGFVYHKDCHLKAR